MSDGDRPDPSEDARLVARAREGDRDAFERLVRRHLRAAHRVALSRTGDPHDADDVCQDAFVRALERLEDCREPESFRAWLLAIVRNRATDLVRGVDRSRREPLDELGPAEIGRVASEPASEETVAEPLAAAIDDLPERQRRVVLMHDYEGWSHREVADELGIAVGTSRYHLHEARKRLRASLAGTGYAEGRIG